jgi:hypothetical protein
MEVSGQLHTPAALPPGKETLIPIGPREKFPAPAGTLTPDHPARSPVLYHGPIPCYLYWHDGLAILWGLRNIDTIWYCNYLQAEYRPVVLCYGIRGP